MSNEILVSVIMPAYNAERTLARVLQSIRMQTIPAEQLEILLIDGGSTDRTRSIAKEYGATILDNPYRLPEPAKRIGLIAAKGRYAMWQDTDEELIDPDQLKRRLDFLRKNPDVKCMVCDDQRPGPDCGIAGTYLCKCGDPFTQFIYRRKGGVIDTFADNIVQRQPDGCFMRFAPGDATPIGDGGTTLFDLAWLRETFPNEWSAQQFVCAVYSRICAQTGCCGCIPGDDIIHHARAGFALYLSKLRFRVINNLFYPQESGYAARTQGEGTAQNQLVRRKYWFVLYAVTLVGPLWDSLRLALRWRNAGMLLHAFYVYYVGAYIAICLTKKMVGDGKRNKSYGE